MMKGPIEPRARLVVVDSVYRMKWAETRELQAHSVGESGPVAERYDILAGEPALALAPGTQVEFVGKRNHFGSQRATEAGRVGPVPPPVGQVLKLPPGVQGSD